MRVNKSGAATVAAVLNGSFADGIAFERIGAVAFGDVKARKPAREFRDAAARGLYFDGDGNGVAVVFDQIKEGEFLGTRGVQRLPELAFAGCTVARRDVNDFVG